MKYPQFDPPALVDDLGDPALLKKYSDHISADFDQAIGSVQSILSKHRRRVHVLGIVPEMAR